MPGQAILNLYFYKYIGIFPPKYNAHFDSKINKIKIMKCKPPFILYNNIQNSYNSKMNISQKYDNKLNLVLSRIPGSVIRETPEIEKIVYPEPKVNFDVMLELLNNISNRISLKINSLNSKSSGCLRLIEQFPFHCCIR